MFLKQVYQINKGLLILFILFILGQTLFTYKGVETVPFFNYGMYSDPMKQKTKGYWLIANGDTLNDRFTHLSQAMLFQQITHHQNQPPNLDNDRLFMTWLKRFTKQNTGNSYTHLTIKAQ